MSGIVDGAERWQRADVCDVCSIVGIGGALAIYSGTAYITNSGPPDGRVIVRDWHFFRLSVVLRLMRGIMNNGFFTAFRVASV